MKYVLTAQDRLAAAGNGNPERSAEELAAHVLGCMPLEVYFREMSPEQVCELEALVLRAEQGEPIQYIIGHVDFRGLEIRCDRRALIPRPETELLVEEVLRSKVLKSKVLKSKVTDQGRSGGRQGDRRQGTGIRGQAEIGNQKSAINNRQSPIDNRKSALPTFAPDRDASGWRCWQSCRMRW